MATAARTMFEIYREAGEAGRHRVVYFTELGEGEREREIPRAMAGEYVYGGFLLDAHKGHGKRLLDEVVRRLDAGEPITATDVARALDGVEARED